MRLQTGRMCWATIDGATQGRPGRSCVCDSAPPSSFGALVETRCALAVSPDEDATSGCLVALPSRRVTSEGEGGEACDRESSSSSSSGKGSGGGGSHSALVIREPSRAG